MRNGQKAATEKKPRAPRGKPDTKKGALLRLLRGRFLAFTLIAAALFCALCVRSYISQQSYSRYFVALNYAEAAKGLAPNNTRFNMYSFMNEELMQSVVEQAALTDVRPDELADCIGISTRGSGGSDYISTGYTLSVDTDSLVQNGHDIHIDAKSLLDLVIKLYKQYFYDEYVSRADALLFRYESADIREYKEMADYYELKLNLLDEYLSDMIGKNSTFCSDTTGLTFNDILERVKNLRNVDLVKTNAYINSTGTVVDKNTYLAKLAYINYRNTEKYQRNFAQYAVRLENVATYDILQSALVLVPTYDTNGEFYMSMAKTGVDDIASAAQTWNEIAAGIALEIDETNYTIERISGAASTDENHTIALNMLAALDGEIRELTELTLLTNGDYMEYTADNYITFTEARLGAFEKIGFTGNALTAFALYVVLWLIAWRNAKKKEVKPRETVQNPALS